MQSVGFVASLGTLLELAYTAKTIPERLANAPKEIASLAQDIARSGSSFYLLAQILADPNVWQRYRNHEIYVLNRHLTDAHSALRGLTQVIRKRHASKSIPQRLRWPRASGEVARHNNALKQACEWLMLDLNSLQFRSLASMQITLADVTKTTLRIEELQLKSVHHAVKQH